MHLQAVFIDRDGTLGGTGHYVHPREFVPFPGALEAIRRLRGAGGTSPAPAASHRPSCCSGRPGSMALI